MLDDVAFMIGSFFCGACCVRTLLLPEDKEDFLLAPQPPQREMIYKMD
jgi:hypothetical protein